MFSLFREPPQQAEQAPRIGILLMNLGTPAKADAKSVRPYLQQFLLDSRVVEIPKIVWLPIVNAWILNTRPRQSALKYRKVWTPEGSPLRIHTERQRKLLAGYFTETGRDDVQVAYAMRYGEPDVRFALDWLKGRQCDRVLVLPLYPQYASSSTGSAFDAVAKVMRRLRKVPEMRFVRSFHDDPAYISALAGTVTRSWAQNGKGEKLVMSFHGVPRYSIEKGDPYFFECHETARLLAQQLNLSDDEYVVTFQSRFGRTEWLRPYTEPTLRELAAKGVKHVDVICPGFVSDCLETLEEVGMEVKTAFMSAGGQQYNYIECLNEDPDFIRALRDIASRHMADWLAQPVPDAMELMLRARRKVALVEAMPAKNGK
ncbi:ferrochelatase [Uliginosibacterium sp. sgz301328]|uniref:ferrochelatase n=1 Tax=Uliginosibacterium sp. sgz301328 TaxID=3243764 RepID=UPI00359D9F48